MIDREKKEILLYQKKNYKERRKYLYIFNLFFEKKNATMGVKNKTNKKPASQQQQKAE